MSKTVKNEKKKLVPRLRFPEFRDAGEWAADALENYTTKVGSGITPRGGDKNYKAEGRPFVRSQNVGWGELILDDIVYIDEKTHLTFSSTEIVANDVLLNISGASIGRSSVASQVISGGNVNQHVCIIRTEGKKLDPFFLNQFLLSQDGQKQIDSFQAGGNRQGLNFGQIRTFFIPFPPKIEEQQKIADCLSSLDALIAAQAEKLDVLKAHKKGLMQQLFPREGETVPRLRFPEFRDAGEWEEKTLRSICERIMDGTHFSPKSKSGPRPYLTSKNIREGRLDLSNLSYISEDDHREIYARCPVKKFDVLLTKDGANTGNCTINTLEDEFSLLSSVAVLRGDASQILQEFLYQSIVSERMQTMIAESMSGQAITRITLEKLGNYAIPLPNIVEQERIANCLSSLYALIAAHTEKLDALKTHKKGLMQQLFPSPEAVGA